MTNRLLCSLIVGAVALFSPAHAGAAVDRCGLTPRIDGARYDVRETRGSVPCGTAMRVVTKFLRDATVKPPWACFRGHGSSPYAASCSSGPGVVVRVYAPT